MSGNVLVCPLNGTESLTFRHQFLLAASYDGDEKLITAEEWIDALRQTLKDGSIRTMDGGKDG